MRQNETLEERYRDDEVLLRFYAKRLLIRGWAGRMDACEQEYLRRKNPSWYAAQKARGIKTQFRKKSGPDGPLQAPLTGLWKEVEDAGENCST